MFENASIATRKLSNTKQVALFLGVVLVTCTQAIVTTIFILCI